MAFPRAADVVIIGGGVNGASIAFNLAERRVRNVVLLEKETL
ncbi:FAD-dependent oxidoreductase, partial [Candidatus Acetothermia bacterium]|nr:FAD-dependent oxidoreductase [Candidatus Acetothermia bacterium]